MLNNNNLSTSSSSLGSSPIRFHLSSLRPSQRKNLEDLLAEAVYKDVIPMNSLQNNAFHQFVHNLNAEFNVPTEDRMINEILPRLSKPFVDEVSNFIAGKNVALSLDIININNDHRVLGMACHVMIERKREDKVFGYLVIPRYCATNVIADNIERLMQSRGLKKDNCISITTPATKEMNEVCKDLMIERIPCCLDALKQIMDAFFYEATHHKKLTPRMKNIGFESFSDLMKLRKGITPIEERDPMFTIMASERKLIAEVYSILEPMDDLIKEIWLAPSTLSKIVHRTKKLRADYERQFTTSENRKLTENLDILRNIMDRTLKSSLWAKEAAEIAICINPRYALDRSSFTKDEWISMMDRTKQYIEMAENLTETLRDMPNEASDEQKMFSLLHNKRKRRLIETAFETYKFDINHRHGARRAVDDADSILAYWDQRSSVIYEITRRSVCVPPTKFDFTHVTSIIQHSNPLALENILFLNTHHMQTRAINGLWQELDETLEATGNTEPRRVEEPPGREEPTVRIRPVKLPHRRRHNDADMIQPKRSSNSNGISHDSNAPQSSNSYSTCGVHSGMAPRRFRRYPIRPSPFAPPADDPYNAVLRAAANSDDLTVTYEDIVALPKEERFSDDDE